MNVEAEVSHIIIMVRAVFSVMLGIVGYTRIINSGFRAVAGFVVRGQGHAWSGRKKALDGACGFRVSRHRGTVTRVEGDNRLKGDGFGGVALPKSASWAENTIITERTRESGHLHSIYVYSLKSSGLASISSCVTEGVQEYSVQLRN